MAELRKIAFVLERFKPDSAAQHLLDRFLIGYAKDGRFLKSEDKLVTVFIPEDAWNADLDKRVKDLKLRRTNDLLEAIEGADGVIVIGGGPAGRPHDETKTEFVVSRVPEGCPVFIHGAPGRTPQFINKLNGIARDRKTPLTAGSVIAAAGRLPEWGLKPGTKIRKAMAIVHGDFPTAEYHGLEILIPFSQIRHVDTMKREVRGEIRVTERRWMFTGVASRNTTSDVVMRLKEDGWDKLYAAAVSRSDSPRGMSVKDGRTQDLSDPDMFAKLATDARLAEFSEIDNYHFMVVVANGVVGDFTVAVEEADGTIHSTQIYQPPAPARAGYDRLAAAIDQMFETGKAPWPFFHKYNETFLLDIVQFQAESQKQAANQAAQPPFIGPAAPPGSPKPAR